MTGRASEEVEARFQRLRESPYSSTFTYGRKKICELLDEELLRAPARARVLDVGCGTGYDIHRLRERGYEVTGVEPDPDLRARARAANPGVEIVDGVVERLPFSDATFDVAFAIDVLPHVEDASRAVAELARVLRPGGRAFATVAPRWSLSSREPRSMTSPQARELFERAGFSTVEVHGLFLGRWKGIGRVSATMLSKLLRVYEPVDDWLADRPLVRDLANHLAVVARK